MKHSARTLRIFSFFSLVVFACTIGCGEPGSDFEENANAGNVGLDGDADSDADGDGDSDADGDGDGDGEEGLPTRCEGPCLEQDLQVEFGSTSGEFERAVYGLTAPEASSSGEWELYIEALQGGFEGCPEEGSPSPQWSLILSRLPLALEERSYTRADDGLAMTFLDFDGRFLGDTLFSAATDVTVTLVAANLDIEPTLRGEDDPQGIVAMEVLSSFEGGQVSGHLVATHCASMDALH